MFKSLFNSADFNTKLPAIKHATTHFVSTRQSTETVFQELGGDDVLVGLPVLAVELLGPVPDGLHLGVLREPGEGGLAAPAVLEDQPPVPLGQGGEGHCEGLAAKQGCLSPINPSPEQIKVFYT